MLLFLFACLSAMPTETLAVFSPSAAAFTQSSEDLVLEDDATVPDPVCDTSGCVLAGEKSTSQFVYCFPFSLFFFLSFVWAWVGSP